MRRLAASLAALGALAMLAGCGGGAGAAKDVGPRNGAAILVSTSYAPSPDLSRLITADAAKSGTKIYLRDSAIDAKTQLAQLRKDFAASSNLQSIVIGAFDPAGAERVIAGGGPEHPLVTSVASELRGARASIALDPGSVAQQLATSARGWAARHGGPGAATVIAPPDTSQVPDWSLAAGRRIAALAAEQLRAAGFQVATVHALGSADAMLAVEQEPAPVVIGWNDVTALGAVNQLDRPKRAGERQFRPSERWIGAAGSPAPTSADALRAVLQGRLQLIVGADLSDLATAIVAAAGAQRTGSTSPADEQLPMRRFSAGSPDTRRALRDFQTARP